MEVWTSWKDLLLCCTSPTLGWQLIRSDIYPCRLALGTLEEHGLLPRDRSSIPYEMTGQSRAMRA